MATNCLLLAGCLLCTLLFIGNAWLGCALGPQWSGAVAAQGCVFFAGMCVCGGVFAGRRRG